MTGAAVLPIRRLSALRDVFHRLMERRPEHFHIEVNPPAATMSQTLRAGGVAGHIAVGPSPVGRLEEEPAVWFDLEIAAAAIAEGKAPP
jgi:hypothetical protein